MEITRVQIRMARALLDWPTKELAKRVGLSVNAINQIENGKSKPHDATLKAITAVLTEAGVEFLKDDGVRRHSDQLRVIEGKDCYVKLLEHVISTMRGKAGEPVDFYCIRDNLSPPAVIDLVEQMHKMGLQTRFIAEEGDDFMHFPRKYYRWIPRTNFNNDVQVTYGEYVGTLINKGEAVYLIHNPSYAQTQRKIFDFVWSRCLVPGKAKTR